MRVLFDDWGKLTRQKWLKPQCYTWNCTKRSRCKAGEVWGQTIGWSVALDKKSLWQLCGPCEYVGRSTGELRSLSRYHWSTTIDNMACAWMNLTNKLLLDLEYISWLLLTTYIRPQGVDCFCPFLFSLLDWLSAVRKRTPVQGHFDSSYQRLLGHVVIDAIEDTNL